MATIRVELPAHLRVLAHIPGYEVRVTVAAPVTVRGALDALEEMYPALLGTIRDQVTKERRAFLRFFCCQLDISHDAQDTALPEAVVRGKEPLIVLGAVAGGVDFDGVQLEFGGVEVNGMAGGEREELE
jgi:sulfur-carrier protein